MGCHFLCQGNFLTQGSNWHVLDWQADALPLSQKGSFVKKKKKKKKCWLASKGEDIFGLVVNLGKLFPTFQKFVLCMLLLLLLSHFSRV